MQLKEWMNKATAEEREALAKAASTSVGYLWQISGYHRKPSSYLAKDLEQASAAVTPDRVLSRIKLLYPEEQVV